LSVCHCSGLGASVCVVAALLFVLPEDVSIRQHTAAYGSIRQHTAAYVSCSSMRTHMVV
jgi:hypothetical protein